MKIFLKIAKIINVIAIMFLLIGAYGLAITGALQVLAATIYLSIFPKNRLIYIYFGLVATFFLIWDQNGFTWLFIIPFFLILFLSYIIHFNKIKTL